MAAAEKLDRGYLGRLLQLTLLAPDLVEAIVDGREAEGATLPALMEPFPAAWDQQAIYLGLPVGKQRSGIRVGGLRTPPYPR
jgi:hypothetical protein